MQNQLRFLRLFVLLSGVSASPQQDFFYSFRISPAIYPKENLTFVLTTENKSPSFHSYRLKLSLVDFERNVTLSKFESKTIPPVGGKHWETVILSPPVNFSYSPIKLHTQVFQIRRDENEGGCRHLVEESVTTILPEINRSFIYISLDKYRTEYVQGDTVYFSVLFLDKNLRVHKSPRNVSISIWKVNPEEVLLRLWSSVEIQTNRPFVSGAFKIPVTFYWEKDIEETFKIFVTVDEREASDVKNFEVFRVPSSEKEDTLLREFKMSRFYSSSSQYIYVQRRNNLRSGRSHQFNAAVDNSWVTLKSGKLILQINATNDFGKPVISGYCTVFQKSSSHHCLLRGKLFNETFFEGQMSIEIGVIRADRPECKESIEFGHLQLLYSKLSVNCTDMDAGVKWSTIVVTRLEQTEFVIDYIHPTNDTFLFKVTRRDTLPLTQIITNRNLSLNYHLKNGSIVEFSEPLMEHGYVEHDAKLNVEDIKELNVSFEDALVTVYSKGLASKPKQNGEDRPLLWKTWGLVDHGPLMHFTFLRETIPKLPIISANPLKGPILVKFNSPLPKNEWEEIDSILITPEKTRTLQYLCFIDLTSNLMEITRSINLMDSPTIDFHFHVKLDFGFGDSLGDVNNVHIRLESPSPLELNDLGSNNTEVVASVKNQSSVRIFGVLFGAKYPNNKFLARRGPHPYYRCVVTNKPDSTLDPGEFCSFYEEDYSGKTSSLPFQLTHLESLGNKEDLADVSAQLYTDVYPRSWKTGWIWTSQNKNKSLYVSTHIPNDVMERSKVIGILVDDKFGLRVTRPSIFDPKRAFTIEVKPKCFRSPSCLKLRPVMQKLTIFNNSNKTLSNVNLSQEDLNRFAVFKNKPSGGFVHKTNMTLDFNIPPFSKKEIDLSFQSLNSGIAYIRLVVSINKSLAVAYTKFYISPYEEKVLDVIPVFVDNVNSSISNVSLTFSPVLFQNGTNTTSYRVDLDLSYNFLSMLHLKILNPRIVWGDKEENTLASLIQKKLALDFIAATTPLNPSFEVLSNNELNSIVKQVPKNFISNVTITCGNYCKHFLPSDIVDVFLNVKTGQGHTHTQHLQRAVDLVLHEYNDIFCAKQKDGNSQGFTKNSIFTRVSYLLALDSAIQSVTNGAKISQFVSQEADELSKQFQNSSKIFDVLTMTYLLDELNLPEADNFFSHAQALKSMVLNTTENLAYIFSKCNARHERDQQKDLVLSSLDLLSNLKRDLLAESYHHAFKLSLLLSKPGASLGTLPLKALIRFARRISGASFVDESMVAEIIGDPRGNLSLFVRGRGTGLTLVILTSFRIPQ